MGWIGTSIYLIQDDGGLVEMTEQSYDSEELLQRLLAEYPNLLPGELIDEAEPRRWLLIDRELGLPGDEMAGDRWYVDHLFVDQDGIPTLVEVKRSSDPRIRREVIGQMLEYAANATSFWSGDTLQTRFEERLNAEGEYAEDVLMQFLGAESDTEQFWETVHTHLRAGKIRLLFVADALPAELQRVIEFLGEQMSPAEVLGVEIRQYTGKGLTTLVPRLIGRSARAKTRAGTRGTHWDEQSYFAELTSRSDQVTANVARGLLDGMAARDMTIWWGRGATLGSFVPLFRHNEVTHQLFAVWTNASVEIYFYWYKNKPPFDDAANRKELLRRLNDIPGVSIPEDGISRRPSIPLRALADDENLQQFLGLYDWFIDKVKAL